MKDSSQTDLLEKHQEQGEQTPFLASEGCGCDAHACSTHSPASHAFEWKAYITAAISFVLLLTGILLDFFGVAWFDGLLKFGWYAIAYGLVAWEVVGPAVRNLLKGSIFNEFFLMTIATVGAFYLGEYAEGVAVMLFYTIGEHVQALAVKRSKNSIKELIDSRPSTAWVKRNGEYISIAPEEVGIGETIQIKAGEKVVLDGELLSGPAEFNTSTLTGESLPRVLEQGEKVLSGMVNLSGLVELKVTSRFEDSTLSRILYLVEKAGSRKAKTQKFISQFAKVYTPIVVFLALGLLLIPSLIVQNYVFQDWLYRSLVFLVISCPCALVISIPLGYFGGLGAGAQNGILFKGANYLDVLAKVETVVFDKTGTLTEGMLKVTGEDFVGFQGNKEELFSKIAALENTSNHPVATAISGHLSRHGNRVKVSEPNELPGLGLTGSVEGEQLLVGNLGLMEKYGIVYPEHLQQNGETMIGVAIGENWAGFFNLGDQVKKEAKESIDLLRDQGVRKIVLLSGDRQAVAEKVGLEVGASAAYGDLLPEDKLTQLNLLKEKEGKLAFVGDGINDAPVLALADVGIAMGAMGSDAAIETADVVIQDDRLTKIPLAIKIGRKTRQIVWQNIALAFGVKALVMVLGGMGMASLWEAVFADVGVALLAILNAVRLQRIFS